MLDLAEPDAESLRLIVRDAVKSLERYHSVPVDDDAVDTSIELTTKYRVREMSLSRAQPERSMNLLDRALTSYRQQAHTRPRGRDAAGARLAEVTAALAGGEAVGSIQGQVEEGAREPARGNRVGNRRHRCRAGRRRRRRSTACTRTRRTAKKRCTRSRTSSSSSASAMRRSGSRTRRGAPSREAEGVSGVQHAHGRGRIRLRGSRAASRPRSTKCKP